MHHLFKATPVRHMVGPDGRTFAALCRLGGWGVTLRVAFSSLTDRQVLVQTATPGVGLAEREPDYHRTEVPEGSLAEVFERHLEEVEAVAAEGGGKAAVATLAELAAIERRSARSLRRIGLGDVAWYPVLGWGVPFLLCWDAFWALSRLPWYQQVGWSMVAAACSYLFFTVKVVPAFLRLCELLPCGQADDEGQDGPGSCAEEGAARD